MGADYKLHEAIGACYGTLAGMVLDIDLLPKHRRAVVYALWKLHEYSPDTMLTAEELLKSPDGETK